MDEQEVIDASAFFESLNVALADIKRRLDTLETVFSNVDSTNAMLRTLQRDVRNLRDDLARPSQGPASGLLN
jgi:hypothetical protein